MTRSQTEAPKQPQTPATRVAAGMPKTPVYPWAALAAFVGETDTRLHELIEAATKAADESSLAVYLGLKNLEARWDGAQSSLLKQVDKLSNLAQKAHTASDTARVKAHLAKEDVLDAARDIRAQLRTISQRLERLRSTLKADAAGDAGAVLQKIAMACDDLSHRLAGKRRRDA